MSRPILGALVALTAVALIAPVLLAPVLFAAHATGDGANTLTEGEKAAGWQLLFDGISTDGWRGFQKDAFPEKGWSIEDGWLQVEEGGGGGDIVTTGTYDHFEFSFEWKAAPQANSGIIYLASEEEATPWMTAPEYQILDDGEAHSAENTSAGGLYALYSPEKKTLHPAGEVNSGRIVVAGDRIEHYLNGALVLTARRGSDDWNARVAASKFAEMAKFGKVEKGHIALQDHGNDVWFRNIKVRTLSPMEVALAARDAHDLFNGRDLTGWTHHLNAEDAKAEDTWSVEDGVLVCKGQPIGYLRTVDDHTNYHLVVEWRWDPETKNAGNSGVLMRMVGEDKVWPRCIEAQLMSGNAGDFYNIGDFPMTTDPERTNGRHTKRTGTNEHPVGDWNRYDILVDGGKIELRVNGELLNSATEAWETPGKICLQSEGAPIHFRKVRIYPVGTEGGKKEAAEPAGTR